MRTWLLKTCLPVVLVAGGLGSILPASAWQPETRAKITDEAVRLMPESLKRALETHREEAVQAIEELVDHTFTEIETERELAMKAIDATVTRALDGIGEQSDAAMDRIEEMTSQGMMDATRQAEELVDYVFVRALWFLAASFAGAVALVVMARMRRKPSAEVT